MIKTTKMSTKIKLLGSMLTVLMISVIGTTIYLNQQNTKDALVVNIVGKQRMLTQKIAKNIFYIYHSSNKDFTELDSAANEFINGLKILEHGDKDKEILAVNTYSISTQLKNVNKLWVNFYENIQKFKLLNNSKFSISKELEKVVNSIYEQNTILLDNVDKLVTMYTNHSEEKTNFIKTFQYLSGITFLILLIYSLTKLRAMESHVDSFIQHSKTLINNENISKITPIKIKPESESEIAEVGDTINCFIQKINSAIEHSDEALRQSQYASSKLEELTDEFDTIINELQDNSLASKHLNNSEDIVIESTEVLINSTHKLSNLKKELEKLTKSCQIVKP
ncbi:type IV pili methyl-accepting chemotaxis transducer N-terminal domain-containing protein [Candidatus Sulfurimonas marisnigri]|uniref:Type IV pili methyl-accepting chemotaxis transducer N-terminal domain-containing protein n=1 Tax=Candidatus Sulfurimonas marisnigri TaxID=2740405 RepID=A0A7S7RQ12_9BACT|nr:type IV pili methyl-accepting chemotaxis transducer N-terminal domain-containing protein [Candidatus Sulfurimonas marisnigri]QOY54134.1 type IV pili methyl-accepting chemotaxis transducer N-terminal domain-containing protein [Candidatus Sulfurimonas marisnigri]